MAAAPDPTLADRRFQWLLSSLVLAASAWLLFYHLDAYYFWGDEVDTALLGRGIARTGDTLAVFGHNVYAYRDGALLKNLHARFQPPLSYYLVAPFVGRSGTSTFWPRFPFAVCGLLTVALLLYWLSQRQMSTAYWIAFSLALLCNVSFFLFDRQCRYNALSTLLSVVIVYLYFHWQGQRRVLAGIVLCSILLFATGYLAYGALYVTLACDYLVFTRRRRPLTFGQMAWVLIPQIVIGLPIFWIFNPFDTTVIPQPPPGSNVVLDRLTLAWYFFRDLNNSELCVGLIVLAAPILYLWRRNIWLLRGALAIGVYTLAIALLEPYPLASSTTASVRYLADEIPLCLAVSALVIATVARDRWQFAAPLAALAFGFTVLNFPWMPSMWRCRPYDFVQEIIHPRETATGRAVQWIRQHVQPGESIWVLPTYMQYSLMYYAPEAVYAWQLREPPEKQFEGLADINFFGREPPDYCLMFGPDRAQAQAGIETLKSQTIEYQLVATLDVFWNDLIRPEIFWRSFYPINNYNPEWEAVYIFHRTK